MDDSVGGGALLEKGLFGFGDLTMLQVGWLVWFAAGLQVL